MKIKQIFSLYPSHRTGTLHNISIDEVNKAKARLEAELAEANKRALSHEEAYRCLMVSAESDAVCLRAELAEATKRAHEHRLAFDWMVVELVPDASPDDIEQLWQEAHAALAAGLAGRRLC